MSKYSNHSSRTGGLYYSRVLGHDFGYCRPLNVERNPQRMKLCESAIPFRS